MSLDLALTHPQKVGPKKCYLRLCETILWTAVSRQGGGKGALSIIEADIYEPRVGGGID